MVQYNEYYPFGLQTAESWTRPDDTRNPYLFNAGSEWNESSLVYETNFRDYDPAIGRFYANDPLSLQGHSLTPYRFGFNNPVSFNDPTGLYEQWDDYLDRKQSEYKISEWQRLGLEFISSDVVRGGSYGGFIKTTETTITTFRGTVAERGGPRYGHGSSSSNAPRYVTFSVAHTTTTMSPNQGLIKFGTSGQNMEPPKGGGPPIGGDPMPQQGQNEWRFVNTHYGEDFFGKFAFEVGLFDPRLSMDDVEALIRYRIDKFLAKELLHDKDRFGPDMEVVGYRIFKDFDIGKGTNSNVLYEVIPKAQWNEPIYGNPGMINEDNGAVNPIFCPVSDGILYLTIYFQYVPKANF